MSGKHLRSTSVDCGEANTDKTGLAVSIISLLASTSISKALLYSFGSDFVL